MSKDFVEISRGTQEENGLDWIIQLNKETGKPEVIIGSDPECYSAVKYTALTLSQVEAFLKGYIAGLGV